MTDPQNFTPAMAADPATAGQVLADIAAARPDLRPMVAANPSAYQGLVDWLAALGDPEVNAAIAARGASAAAAALPADLAPEGAAQIAPELGDTQVLTPDLAETQVLPAPANLPPAPSWATDATAVSSPAPAAPAPQAGFSQQPPVGGYAPPQAGGYPQPQQWAQPGAAPTKPKSKVGLIVGIVLAVVLLIVAGIVVAVMFAFNAVKDAASDLEDQAQEVVDQVEEDIADDFTDGADGDTAELDALKDACLGGAMEACDELFWAAPIDSEYEEIGRSCGGVSDGTQVTCTDLSGDGASDDADAADTGWQGQAYGDNANLDNLWDLCETGDMVACDQLYSISPLDSEYEAFGETCGQTTTDTSTWCAGSDDFGGPYAHGDDASLDALWDGCEAGDMGSCDDLYFAATEGSLYYIYASTCGQTLPYGNESFCEAG